MSLLQQAGHCGQAAVLGRLSLSLCLWYKLSVANGGKNFVFNINNTVSVHVVCWLRLSQVIVGENRIKQIRCKDKAFSCGKGNEN